MLLRIWIIAAILAGLGSGGVAYYEWSTQLPAIASERNQEHAAKVAEIAAHNQTQGQLNVAKANLAQTRQELAATKSDIAKAVARDDAQQKRAADLQGQLAKVDAALQDVQSQVAEYQATGLKPEEVVKLRTDVNRAGKNLANLKTEADLLHHSYDVVYARLLQYEDPPEAGLVELSPDLKGNVTAVDPKWAFVVLNIGKAQGAETNGEMLVSRSGKLVAKVIIHSVEKDRCIADILPRWKLGELLEGDLVTPAHPASLPPVVQVGSASY